MSSRIEQLITEIEEYIDGCKYVPFSKTTIQVNREEIQEYLKELKNRTPEEIKRYQKIIERKEAILDDAKKKAGDLISQAELQTNELVSESEIMQQAYARANEIILAANQTANERIDKATNEANAVRESAIRYLDEMLGSLEKLLEGSLNTTNAHYESFTSSIQEYLNIIHSDQQQLHPDMTPGMDDLSVPVLPADGVSDGTDTMGGGQ
ncbi:MAG: hypothetical protein K6E33_06580 [Lachnospiraceae bacterium]|nr:hypothetical protein [Lachnospiraceae bacterium]